MRKVCGAEGSAVGTDITRTWARQSTPGSLPRRKQSSNWAWQRQVSATVQNGKLALLSNDKLKIASKD